MFKVCYHKNITCVIKAKLKIYCLVCKKRTDNYGSKNVNATNKAFF